MEIEKYYDIIVEKLIGWSEQIVKLLPNFILAILVLIAFVFVGKIIKKLAQQLFDRTFKNFRHALKALNNVDYDVVGRF